MKTPGGLVLRSFLALAVAGVTYLYGFWVGHFLDLRGVDAYCSGKPLDTPSTGWTWLPLTHSCRWADGSTTDLVPWYVNLIIFICLIVAVTCAALAVRTTLRNRTTTP